MPRTIRFHLDEHVDVRIATGLRAHGIAVTTTEEAGLRQATDEEQLAYARTEVRVIHTNDPDFLRLHKAGEEHMGIVFCAHGTRTIGYVIDMLKLMWEIYDPEEMRNRLEFI
jgi:predicted nuclease of predicted toxin-antitoxin system